MKFVVKKPYLPSPIESTWIAMDCDGSLESDGIR